MLRKILAGGSLLVLAGGALAATTISVASPEPVAFDGVFWEGGEQRAIFHVELGEGELQQMRLGKDRIVEIGRPLAGPAQVRLLDAKGEVLHSGGLGDGTQPTSFRIAMCDAETMETTVPAGTGVPCAGGAVATR